MSETSTTPRPTTLSYAILGLLAVQPFTAHELKVQAERSLNWLWRRSERSLYAEPKRLVALGWAVATDRRAGRRTVAEYHITESGRAALKAWLGTEPGAPAVEAETVLRVMFADHGDLDDLRQALVATRREITDTLRAQAYTQFVDYLETGGPFPERLHLIAPIADFVVRYVDLIEEWTDELLAQIDDWPTTEGLGLTEPAKQVLSDAAERFRPPAEGSAP